MPTAQQHPNVLGALSALADLADQYRWLADLLEPGRQSRRPPAAISPAARAQQARQHRAERQDLAATLRSGLKPTGTGKTPPDLHVLDVQILALTTVMDAAWRCTDHLRSHPDARRYSGGGHNDGARFTIAAGYLGHALPHASAVLAGELGDALNQAYQVAWAVTGAKPTRSNFDRGPCPACGRDTLRVQTTTIYEAALILCSQADCRCRGLDCLCRRPGRTPELRHIWHDGEFGQLKAVLRRVA